MRSEQRTLLAIVLSVAVLILWYTVLAPKQPPPSKTQKPSEEMVSAKEEGLEVSKPLEEVAPTADDLLAAEPKGPEERVDLSTQHFEAEFSSYGGRLTSLRLKGYHANTEADSPLIDLAGAAEERAIELVCRHCNFHLPRDPAYSILAFDETSVTFRFDGQEMSLIRKYTVDEDRYLIQHTIEVLNRSEKTFEGQLGLSWTVVNPMTKRGFLSMLKRTRDGRSVIYQMGGQVERVKKDKKDQEAVERGVISWAGLESRYFLSALISRQLSEQEVFQYRFRGQEVTGALYYPKVVVPAGETETIQYSVYVGPKEIHSLDSIGVGLDEAIDYGWFSFLAVPILHLLKFFHNYVYSWGLAIIVLTIVVKLLMNPLTVKGMKSMKAMQKMQPKIKELREKYKDDKQRLNQETMALFRSHKVNPMGGCLPMILQMPIYIALYKVLYNSIELYHAPFWFYKDLAAPDPYLATPILLGLFMVFQQKMTPTASADPAQKKMMMFMPIMFTGFMIFLPMGLVLYILVNTVMTVIQQYMMNHDIRWRDILRGRIKLR